MNNKLQTLTDKVTADLREFYKDNSLESYRNAEARLIPGPKYSKIDVSRGKQWSGLLMVENETGIIYGIKAYGVVHKGHQYGTLETINDYFWGGYKPAKIQ